MVSSMRAGSLCPCVTPEPSKGVEHATKCVQGITIESINEGALEHGDCASFTFIPPLSKSRMLNC